MTGYTTVRDIAISSVKSEALLKERTSNENALFFIGDKNVGKSSLIYRLLDKNEVPKPTLALEYVFFRRSTKSLTKEVFHVWELGGGVASVPMVSVISNLKVDSLSIVLMLDLFSLNNLWNTLELYIRAAKTCILENKTLNKKEEKESKKENSQEPFPVPLVILGAKYDKFHELEPQKKRTVCQCLRFVAHFYGASLVFHSSADASLAKRTREFLINPKSNSHIKAVNLDHSKPLFIPAGMDSFSNIERTSDVEGPWNMEKYKQLFTTHFEQESSFIATVPDDPTLDSNFREPSIDILRQRKDEELEFLRQEKKGRLNN